MLEKEGGVGGSVSTAYSEHSTASSRVSYTSSAVIQYYVHAYLLTSVRLVLNAKPQVLKLREFGGRSDPTPSRDWLVRLDTLLSFCEPQEKKERHYKVFFEGIRLHSSENIILLRGSGHCTIKCRIVVSFSLLDATVEGQ